MTDPRTLNWQYGEIPDVETVGFDTRLLVFADAGWVANVWPHGGAGQALRWWGPMAPTLQPWERPTGWWTVLRHGRAPRPAHVKTWREVRV